MLLRLTECVSVFAFACASFLTSALLRLCMALILNPTPKKKTPAKTAKKPTAKPEKPPYSQKPKNLITTTVSPFSSGPSRTSSTSSPPSGSLSPRSTWQPRAHALLCARAAVVFWLACGWDRAGGFFGVISFLWFGVTICYKYEFCYFSWLV